MKIRVKYEKTGINKYIGHLDLLRYFQKAMRRAGIDMKYTEGFSPHPVLSFAAPLGLGLTTRGDYFDTELETDATVSTFVARLNAQRTEVMKVLSISEMEGGKKQNAMASLAAADYEVTVCDALLEQLGGAVRLNENWQTFMAQDTIPVEKETKSGTETVDLKPLIYAQSISKNKLVFCVSASSAANVRPDTLFTAFLRFTGHLKAADEMLKDGEIEIERSEMYTRDAEGTLIPLAFAGRLIEQE